MLFGLGGCAGATATAPRSATSLAPAARVGAQACDDGAQRAREQGLVARTRELEAQLALARAEARDARADLAVRVAENEARERAQITRIRSEAPEEPPVEAGEPAAPERGPRPVLRLYGTAPAPSASYAPIPGPPPPAIAAAPPPGGAARLPVVLSPGSSPFDVPAIPIAPVPVAPPEPAPPPPAVIAPSAPSADEIGAALYRRALAAMSDRRLDEALAGFDGFLAAHPAHPYADNAHYWRGEIHFARRDYARAAAEMQRLIERYPNGNRVPDAMLRLGICLERLGETARARAVLQELRSRFPQSVAARMASREDA